MSDPAVVVAVVRNTIALTDQQVASWVAAAQIACTRDFAPHWCDATLAFVRPGQSIPTGAYQLWLNDRSGEADALGYHDDQGLPISHVGVLDAADDGVAWSVTASHELWEMLADPKIDKTVTFVTGDTTYEIPLEVADAPEDGQARFLCPLRSGRRIVKAVMQLLSVAEEYGAAFFGVVADRQHIVERLPGE